MTTEKSGCTAARSILSAPTVCVHCGDKRPEVAAVGELEPGSGGGLDGGAQVVDGHKGGAGLQAALGDHDAEGHVVGRHHLAFRKRLLEHGFVHGDLQQTSMHATLLINNMPWPRCMHAPLIDCASHAQASRAQGQTGSMLDVRCPPSPEPPVMNSSHAISPPNIFSIKAATEEALRL